MVVRCWPGGGRGCGWWMLGTSLWRPGIGPPPTQTSASTRFEIAADRPPPSTLTDPSALKGPTSGPFADLIAGSSRTMVRMLCAVSFSLAVAEGPRGRSSSIVLCKERRLKRHIVLAIHLLPTLHYEVPA